MTQVTVLGGGQLGWMLGLAGLPLGVRCTFLDPGDAPTAAMVGPVVHGGLDDLVAAEQASEGARVITYEWEGVPAGTARHLAPIAPVRPPARALEVAQDRLAEKEACSDLSIPTAQFHAIDSRADLDRAVAALGLPAVLKTRRGGYDGKGQAVLRRDADVDRAWADLGGVPLILEAFVPFRRELSIVAVRAESGDTRCWPVVENEHRDGILRITRAPARGHDGALQAQAEACILPWLDALDYVGVGCVELFDVDGTLFANEIAPRVHNSGHWSIEGAETSQFENHLRAVLGWPLGSTDARGPAAMVNCIGTMPDRDAVLAITGTHLYDYGKEPRPGRKLGHVTVLAPDPAELEARLARVVAVVDGDGSESRA
jgi:5-(carboxyamino)imidazole ribonucleotide synthase